MAKNIQMNVLGSDGQYEDIYPQTLIENVIGLQDELDGINNNLSQNYYTKQQTIQSSTLQDFNLQSTNVPDDVFQILKDAALVRTTGNFSEIGALEEGTIIYLKENGVDTPFYVAKQNYESNYNSNRTLVVRKEYYQQEKWNSSRINTYNGSTIDTWFNSTYFNLLDNNLQTAIGTTNIPATSPYNSGVIRLQKSIFALSITELKGAYPGTNMEGSQLPIYETLYFPNDYYGEKYQATRSPQILNTTQVFVLNTHNLGGVNWINADSEMYYRPAFTLPSNFEVSISPISKKICNTEGKVQTYLFQMEEGSYIGTGVYGENNINTLNFNFIPQIVYIIGGPSGEEEVIFIRDSSTYSVLTSNYKAGSVIWSENSIQWYTNDSNALSQLNQLDSRYIYIALGY